MRSWTSSFANGQCCTPFGTTYRSPWSETHVAAAELDCQLAFHDEEEVIGVWVGVQHDLAPQLDHHPAMAVEGRDDLW